MAIRILCFSILFHLGIQSCWADESGTLNLIGRVYPQISVELAPSLDSYEQDSSEASYKVSSNMGAFAYKVFFNNSSKNGLRTSNKARFRQLVVEAN